MPDIAGALAKIEASNRNDLAVLRQDTAPAIVRACLQLQRDLLAANRKPRDPRFTVEAAGQQLVSDLAAARQKGNAALDSAEQAMRQAEANVRADLQAKVTPKLDDSQQLVHELQKQAARRRIDQAQAAGVSAEEIIRRAAAQGDRVALESLREDIPFAATVNNRQDQAHLEALMALLDQNEAPLLSAMEAAKRAIEAELAVGLSQQATGLGVARMFAAGQRSMPPNLPDWAKGKTLPVAFTTPDGGIDTPDTPKATGTTGWPPRA